MDECTSNAIPLQPSVAALRDQLIDPSPGLRWCASPRLHAVPRLASPSRRERRGRASAELLEYIEDADNKYDARLAQLDLLTAFASPETFPNKRKGVFNTVDFSTLADVGGTRHRLLEPVAPSLLVPPSARGFATSASQSR